MDEGIAPDEILVFIPASASENSTIKAGIDIGEVRDLLGAGLPPGEVFIAYTQPKDINSLSLRGE